MTSPRLVRVHRFPESQKTNRPCYVYLFPYFSRIQSANELPRVYLVKAIVEDHSFAIDNGIRRWGGTSDMAASHWIVERDMARCAARQVMRRQA